MVYNNLCYNLIKNTRSQLRIETILLRQLLNSSMLQRFTIRVSGRKFMAGFEVSNPIRDLETFSQHGHNCVIDVVDTFS